ncbi:MAG: TonB-dependent receptor [Candidatus Omnitrophica bacterium]|nr:TonB-dependent receptor [Candidatus Omnitrophota bacterium]
MEIPEITVWGKSPIAASSEKIVPGEDFHLRPLGRPADLLRLAPGLAIAQHAGGGKADQQFLRGFDSDHGTDVLMTLDGMPVNIRSHAHGQGYADMHFIIPETVEALEVTKGPYDIRQGDFATAGAVNFLSRHDISPSFIEQAAGRFDLRRSVFLWSPLASDKTKSLVAFEAYHHDGPFLREEGYDRYNGFAKATFSPAADLETSLLLTHNKGDWTGSGQIPLRAVQEGWLNRFGAIDESEGGRSRRTTANFHASWLPDDRYSIHAQFYFQHYALDLYSNFTFFLDDPVNGDGIGQFDRRNIYGAEIRYKREQIPLGMETSASIGFQTRIDQAQVRLVRQAQRNILCVTQDADLLEGSYSPYLEAEINPIEKVRFVTGIRGDFFHYQVEDNLPGSTALNGVVSDKRFGYTANLILGPWFNTEFFVNHGQGFHSNDARAVILSPGLEPLPKARGTEVGAHTQPVDWLEMTGTLWLIDLESELVFVGDAGTTEARGKTRRYGWEIETRVSPLKWFNIGGDLTYSHAEFTATGEAVPRAPKLVGRADVTAKTPWGLSSSLEMRHFGSRPGIEDRSITLQGYTVFDWTNRYRLPTTCKILKGVELFLSVENLLDREYREAQFVTETQLASESSSMEEIHFTPGWPRTVIAGMRGEF